MATPVMTSSEIRQKFVDYFKKQSHRHIESSSLIPENDPTLLFTNAGMNQFKNAFLGVEKRDYNRAVTVQKCVRAGGKHNDLENVGFTARHHTFFEMLGNFSFGDYFKKDAIRFAWELLTKDLGIPKEKLYVTVFETDDEAADIWHKQEGVPKDRIFRLGEKDNFWRMGDTGPCGPCSEIFYDHGPRAGKESDPFKGIVAGEDRFVEIWNLVFMQFYEKSPGVMEPLPKPSVDTGSGLERVVAALQGKFNNYDTDLFSPMIEVACKKAGWNFADLLKQEDALRDGKGDASVKEKLAALRVMADHVRSSSFLIADGALPSNEGRGYVLRRILRRAIRYGRKVSTKDSFLADMSRELMKTMGAFYPELNNRKDVILSTLEAEETRFLQTLDTGTAILEEELKKLKSKKVPGELAFKLYDTYGFPFDLTQLMAAEKGYELIESEFDTHMDQARTLAKKSWKGKGLDQNQTFLLGWSQKLKEKNGPTQFSGYEGLKDQSEILGLSDGQADVPTLNQGQAGILVLKKTPFYAEGGGQVGDQGTIKTDSGEAIVHSTMKQNDLFLHQVEVTKGLIKAKEKANLEVHDSERRNTANNHSATHLLHAALRKVLGTHVTQQGSLVDTEKLRFDFSHNKPLTKDEILSIEKMVNEQIAMANPVQAAVMSHKKAIESGALALFGEKYGDEVRVLKMGDFSTELCGGTHVTNTAQIRLLKIVSESGVSAGVRRIEALTGENAVRYLMKHMEENLRTRQATGQTESWSGFMESKAEPSQWIESIKAQVKDLEKEIRKGKSSAVDLDQMISQAKAFALKGSSHKLVSVEVDQDDREILAQWADHLKNKVQSGVVVLLGKGTDSHPLIVSVSKNLNPEIKAGDVLRDLAQAMGGKGGGRPDFAQGAVPQREGWNSGLKKLQETLKVN